MKIRSIEFNNFGEQTYIIWDEATRETAIVDPGMSNDMEREIFNTFITDNGLKPIHLILTHLHIDHVMGVDYVKSKYHLPIEANSADNMLANAITAQAYAFRLSNASAFKNISIEGDLKDGDKVWLGNEYLQVIEVPGHSQGSIALYSAKDNFVVTGDALFQGSIGRTDLPGGNHQQLVKSIKEKLLTLPPHTIVYPGHGMPTTIEAEAYHNPFL